MPEGGNGTQRDIGELMAKTEALAHSIDVVRSEQQAGFSALREEIAAYSAQTRSEIGGCRAHEATQMGRLEALAITNRSLSTKAVTTAQIALTIGLAALAGVGGVAFWIYEHVTAR